MDKTKFKTQVKDWWKDNKRVIKTGIACLTIGVCYGFAKGVLTAFDISMRTSNISAVRPDNLPESSDEYGLTDSNIDDPELLEIVKMENENS